MVNNAAQFNMLAQSVKVFSVAVFMYDAASKTKAGNMKTIADLKAQAETGTRAEKIAAYLDLARAYLSGEQTPPDALQALLCAVEAAKLGSVDGVTQGVEILSAAAKQEKDFPTKCEYVGQIASIFPLEDMEQMGCDEALAIAGSAYEDMAVTRVIMAANASDRGRAQHVEASVDYFIHAYDAYTSGGHCAKSETTANFCADRLNAVEENLKKIAANIVAYGQIYEEKADRVIARNDLAQTQPPAWEAYRSFAFVVSRFAGIDKIEPMVIPATQGLARMLEKYPFLAPENQPARNESPRAGQNRSPDFG